MGKFVKAKSEQAFFKAVLYGKPGSGKTLTSLIWAEKLAERDRKRIAFVDTEHGVDYYCLDIPERTVHPKAFDFDRLVTRSLMEVIEAIENLDTKMYCVLILDSVTHIWEAARAAYNGKLLPNGGLPIPAWQLIKKPYKKLMSLLLDGSFHVTSAAVKASSWSRTRTARCASPAPSSRPKAKPRMSLISSAICARSGTKRAATSSRSSSRRTAPEF
jgi:hypothetical protein